MKKVKYLLIVVAISLLIGRSLANAQDTSYTNRSTSVSTTSTQDTPAVSNPTALVVGGVAVLILGVVLVLMYRNRRKTIGGIQKQDKAEPTPVTTESINNPGAGV